MKNKMKFYQNLSMEFKTHIFLSHSHTFCHKTSVEDGVGDKLHANRTFDTVYGMTFILFEVH